MILTIIAVLFLIAVAILLIVAKKSNDLSLISLLKLISIFLSFFAGMLICLVISNEVRFDTKEYNMLMREIEYGQVYSSDVERRIYSWDDELTKTNNYWFRFQTKDREQYYIDVNLYLDKFEPKNEAIK